MAPGEGAPPAVADAVHDVVTIRYIYAVVVVIAIVSHPISAPAVDIPLAASHPRCCARA